MVPCYVCISVRKPIEAFFASKNLPAKGGFEIFLRNKMREGMTRFFLLMFLAKRNERSLDSFLFVYVSCEIK